ncbi:MAG: hypothetical protein AAB605_04025, partial [Patescibacteria group bacterium]
YEGRMDIVRVYNAILSASDIQALYNGTRIDDTPTSVNKITSPIDGATITSNSLTVSGTCAVNGDNPYLGIHINNSIFGTTLHCINNMFSDTVSIASLSNGSLFTVQAVGDQITLFKNVGGIYTASCTLDGVTVAHGQSWTFYSTNTVPAGQSCSSVSQSRTCTNGTLSGSISYNRASCSVAGGSNAGASCTYNRQTYANGQVRREPVKCPLGPDYDGLPPTVCLDLKQCTNGQWVSGSRWEFGTLLKSSEWSGGITVMPIAGSAPLAVKFESDIVAPLNGVYKLYVYFGDSTKSPMPTLEQPCEFVMTGGQAQRRCNLNTVYTYTTASPSLPGYNAGVLLTGSNPIPGDYRLSKTVWRGGITVTSGTQADSGASLQLASALTALEEALKGILQYLTR